MVRSSLARNVAIDLRMTRAAGQGSEIGRQRLPSPLDSVGLVVMAMLLPANVLLDLRQTLLPCHPLLSFLDD